MMVAEEDSAPVEMDQNVQLDGVKLFPNPSSENIQIQFNCAEAMNAQLEVISLSGQVQSSQSIAIKKGQQTHRIKTQDLKPGYYLITIRNEKVNKVLRFIKL